MLAWFTRRPFSSSKVSGLGSRYGKPPIRRWHFRPYSTRPDTVHVEVPCASSGHITVSLHNTSISAEKTPWIINIPPVPNTDPHEKDSYLPSFLRGYPTATIHYRWGDFADPTGPSSPSNSHGHDADHEALATANKLRWPIPLHDMLFGYTWLVAHLTSPTNTLQRRDLYVYGSWLGAGLATTLALTESRVHEAIAVRGLLAANGVYDWTTFLPDHPINARPTTDELGLPLPPSGAAVEDIRLSHMEALMPDLFASPNHLFDSFVSPLLFFHTSPTPRPSKFGESVDMSGDSSTTNSLLDQLAGSSALLGEERSPYHDSYADRIVQAPDLRGTTTSSMVLGTTRKSYYVYPPRVSGLKLPDTLLLHDSKPDVAWAASGAKLKKRSKTAVSEGGNSFARQAFDLAAVMNRSVDKVELKDRRKWDVEMSSSTTEAEVEVRVRLGDIGRTEDHGDFPTELGDEASRLAREWLQDRIGY